MTGSGALVYILLKAGLFGLLTWMWLQSRRAAKEIEARRAERARMAAAEQPAAEDGEAYKKAA